MTEREKIKNDERTERNMPKETAEKITMMWESSEYRLEQLNGLHKNLSNCLETETFNLSLLFGFKVEYAGMYWMLVHSDKTPRYDDIGEILDSVTELLKRYEKITEEKHKEKRMAEKQEKKKE